jgi:transcription elongation GreA/GreB family factor
MEKLKLKKKLFEQCIRQQINAAESTKAVIDDAQESANEYGSPKDRYDSYRMQLLNRKDVYAKHLQVAIKELDVLNRIDLKKEHDSVGFGSVVFTEQQRIFVSIGLGKIELDEGTYYAISPTVPFCQAMVGLKKGDSFTFRDKKIRIEDVF